MLALRGVVFSDRTFPDGAAALRGILSTSRFSTQSGQHDFTKTSHHQNQDLDRIKS